MRKSAFAALAVAAATATSTPGFAANNLRFSLVRSSTVATCAPNARAIVTIEPHSEKETMHIEVFGLAPNIGLDVFLTQVPSAPFGMSWYQGDMTTDANGVAVANFEGRFNIETFVIAPGAAAAPWIHAGDARTNPATNGAIHTFHIGIWFNRPADAVAAGCPGTVTPFNGEHNAGVQVLNSGNFPDAAGPLRRVQ